MSLEVLDWRRKVAALYADVRAAADPAAAHSAWCTGREELIRSHPASPRCGAVVHHAPYDASLRFVVPVDTTVDGEELRLPTATDGVVPFSRIGILHLEGIGDLDVWWLDSYGGGVWLPVRDPSPRTYGGGRYLLDTVKGADLGGDGDTVVVDLNFAYNPSCAYDEAWACPLAPPGNRLDVPVEAGELLPG